MPSADAPTITLFLVLAIYRESSDGFFSKADPGRPSVACHRLCCQIRISSTGKPTQRWFAPIQTSRIERATAKQTGDFAVDAAAASGATQMSQQRR
ncbi:hypothetical protein GQ43DRAFT_238352 [Delitschia confertaspora ATCC 74209]|uniref:Uncharacterized protein n=1 Tax=Delitschia confertaspora ATCC 74209 TaxID=1513339 RepID=A0A9P4JEG3_9PLEO|nr:hypothetical protein GQ43DRAFT_238352 [Delitschia confertaspora ATCC 74209]